ncbi:MAG TPA: maleylpyruvate isomerase N-terminal domain-containing protein [Longimicrobium sp.]|nr:maleylpyruvate isomerase N-terminal domain-containing protein [Longimicrobium sp.]
MEPLTPVDAVPLFAPLHAELVALLRGLDDADWAGPTVAGAWRVRDVAAHLLDGELRRLSAARDGVQLAADGPVESFGDVVGLINGLNASGVAYARRLSPRIITDLLEVTGRWISGYFASLPPHETATWPVAWAGEARSENWMDVGRDYTEQWHHQMQIRDAVGAPGLLQRRWLHPLLDLSVRAFRRAYQGVEAAEGTAVVFEVRAEGENTWSVVRQADGWEVFRGAAPGAAARVRTDADTAWRLLYHALSPEAARARVSVEGNATLAEPIIRTRSVMV